MHRISDEQLADANLTRSVLRTVMREISGSEKEAFAHWNVISEHFRDIYRLSTV